MILNAYLLPSVCFSSYFWVTGLFGVRWGPALLKAMRALSEGNKVSKHVVEAGVGRRRTRGLSEVRSAVRVLLLKWPRQTMGPPLQSKCSPPTTLSWGSAHPMNSVATASRPLEQAPWKGHRTLERGQDRWAPVRACSLLVDGLK